MLRGGGLERLLCWRLVFSCKTVETGNSHCASVARNLPGTHEITGSIPGFTQCVKDPALPRAVVYVIDEALICKLLWLWPATVLALIQPLAWQFPYDTGVALKKKIAFSRAGVEASVASWSPWLCLLWAWGGEGD